MDQTMPRKTRNGYERLAKRGRAAFAVVRAARQSLWLGDDHLLIVNNNSYTEEYRRLFLRDVQALLVRETRAGRVGNILLAIGVAAAALPLSAGLMFGWPAPVNRVLGGIAGVMGLGLAINTVRGPTCTCTISTAVQTQTLFTLHRLRATRKVVPALRERIETVQGAVTPENIDWAAAATHVAGTSQHAVTSNAKPPRTGDRPANKVISPRLHSIVFPLLLCDAVHSALSLVANTPALVVIGVLLGVTLIVLTALALARQRGSVLPVGVRRITWCSAGYLTVSYIVGSAFTTVYPLLHPDVAGNSWSLVGTVTAMDPMTSPPLLILLILSAGCSAILGTLGLLRLASYHRSTAIPPPPPPGPPPPPPPS